jgi:hypothetical protein
MTKEERGEKGFKLHKLIEENEKKRRALLLENVLYLNEILTDQLYKEILGDEEAEWVAYLAQLQVYYTRSEVIRWIRIKRKLVDEFGLDASILVEVPITRLENICGVAVDKAQAEQLIGVAKVQLGKDWKDTIAALKGKPTMEECQHLFNQFEICKTCGFRHKLGEGH